MVPNSSFRLQQLQMLIQATTKEDIVMTTSNMLRARIVAHNANSDSVLPHEILRIPETPNDEETINGKQNVTPMMSKTISNAILRGDEFELVISPINPDIPIIVPIHIPPPNGIVLDRIAMIAASIMIIKIATKS